MIFNSKERLKDERIERLYNKIFREAYLIAIVIAVISILTKYFYYGLNTEYVIFEFAFIIVTSLYFLIRSVFLGIYSDAIELHDKDKSISLPMSVKQILIGIAAGFGIALFFGVRSALLYGGGGNQVEYFFLVFGASFMIYLPALIILVLATSYIARKKSEQVNMEDED